MYLKPSLEAISRVSVWKRYSDFRKLHSELKVLSTSLTIKEPFPQFARPRYFGRFEAEVIEERRLCALQFLEFIARHTPLFKSEVFVKFFDNDINVCLTDCSQSMSSDASEDDRNANVTDTDSLNNSTSLNVTQNRLKNGQSISNELPKFVYTEQIKPTVSKRIYQSSTKVRPDQNYGKLSMKNQSIDNSPLYQEPGTDQIMSKENLSTQSHSESIAVMDTGQLTSNCTISSTSIDVKEFLQDKESPKPTHVISSVLIHDGSDLLNTQEDSAQYILIAAAHMSAAFRHEVIAEYEEAFTQYKLGISNLLNGVQTDPDVNRRYTIKNKITKYLERAERLYNRHLNCNISLLCKPITELQNYKVLRVIGSVILVRDIMRECNRMIKTVEKPAGRKEDISNYILRGKVPHMVQLYACVQTETTVFLVLEYASGGKLWEHVKTQYKSAENKISSYKKSHTRSISCGAVIQPDYESVLDSSHKNRQEEKKIPEIKHSISDFIQHDDVSESQENLEISPEESLRRLEEEFGANSKYNRDLPTTDLLEKAQKLLQSVNATLKKSNSIASRLNESEELLHPYHHSDSTLEKDSLKEIVEIDIHIQESEQDCVNYENNSVKMMKPLSDNENTEESYDLSELSTSESCTDLSLGKDKVSSILEEGTPNMELSQFEYELSKKTKSTNGTVESSQFIRMNGGSQYADELQLHTGDDSGVEMEQELWKVPETIIRQWAAEVLLALESLHQQDVIIADLRPDNILLDDNGQVVMTYVVPRRDVELPRSRKPYMSPELSMFLPAIPATSAADIWSFGVILYELLTGIQFQWRHPGPFHSHSIVSIPDEISQTAKSLLFSILKYEPNDRLTIPEIKQHPFFEQIDWANLLNP
ncbi:ribosomal protein S6 kinase delta-1 isoform X2 [Cephus cinctus]|nr:ribosomal protein S6 kinase delta-1 isoform X2 [Cephus cinctus]XP_024938901.1 ribosomal protein S6 kinase delta-1 isoform X2 [Cephus cinctus]